VRKIGGKLAYYRYCDGIDEFLGYERLLILRMIFGGFCFYLPCKMLRI
jgi:hypothetical protein